MLTYGTQACRRNTLDWSRGTPSGICDGDGGALCLVVVMQSRKILGALQMKL
jgi:hypothetical protein